MTRGYTAGAALIIAWLALSTFSSFIPQIFPGPPVIEPAPDLTIAERFRYVGMMFGPLPDWVKRWMGLQQFVFASSMLFALFHREARIYLMAIIASHAISFLEIAFLPVSTLGLGLVALNHWLWIPALVIMVRNWPRTETASGYAVWYAIAIFQLTFSLIFDIRDGALYLAGMF